MIVISGISTKKRKCVVCQHKTGMYREYGYCDGICITVPVCSKCKDDTGMFLNGAMEAHLKAIAQSVRMSRIITGDENHIRELREGKL